MLRELHIENIAVIERADIEPGAGLNVLTGETGAGKSIVIDSLEAVLGARASRELVRTGAARASVTAAFTADNAEDWLEENGLDAEDGVIIRRRVSQDGKSSAQVNGVPVAAAELRALGSGLLDIHGQNDGRQLMDETRHRDYLDGFAGIAEQLSRHRELYSAYRETAAQLRRLDEALAEIEQARSNIEDAAERLRDFREGLDFSPGEYDALETRLSQLRRLEKKYGRDEAGLAELLESAQRGLEELDSSAERRAQLEAELAKRKKAAYNSAKELSKLRKAAGEELRERIELGLRELSMPSVRFEAEIVPMQGEPGFDESGMDEVRFLMSANAGETPGRISKIASGGELVMKDVLSERDGVPAMVFDEIDVGVSGIAAQRVAEKLARLARKKQVICVTHLPQIAAMADTHFLIEKTERDGRTYTKVTPLEREGRIRELARLHGGDNVTETTLASAAEQLDAAYKYKGGL